VIPFEIRDARAEDAAEIAVIYGHYVRTSSCTFEELPPTVHEIRERIRKVRSGGLPYRVAAQDNSGILGYAYVSPFHIRWGYRYSVENSVYVAAGHGGQGIGTALMTDIIHICTDLGYRQMIAVIGDRANEASIRLHKRLGFRIVGELEAVGLKFQRWIDVIDMQRALGDGVRSIPIANPGKRL
jgi:L-amino acid N-acyltransferase YncA